MVALSSDFMRVGLGDGTRKSVGKKAAEKWQKEWPELITNHMMALLAATGTRMLLTGDDRARFVVQAFAEAIETLEKQVEGYDSDSAKAELKTVLDEATGIQKAGKNDLIRFYKARVPCKCLKPEKEPEPPKEEEPTGNCSFAGCGETKPLSKLAACAGCQVVTYCSVDCQSNDWPEHSKDCERLNLEREQREAAYGTEEGSSEYDDEDYDSEYDSEYDSDYDSEYDDSGFEESEEEVKSEEEEKKKTKTKDERPSKKSKDKEKTTGRNIKEKSAKKDKEKSSQKDKEKTGKKDKEKKDKKKTSKSKSKAAQV